MNKLSIGSDFPKISLETTEGKSLIIPQDIKTRYCILLFIRGAWWPKCTLQLEGYRKHLVLFNRIGATIIAASVDLLKDMRLLAEGKRFPKREKNMGFTICYGVTRELADSLGEPTGMIPKKIKIILTLWVLIKTICNLQNSLLIAK